MVCLISDDRKMAICGGFNKREFHYFAKNYRAVLFCDSVWYEPNLVKKLRRKKFERIDLFKKRVRKTLGFMPKVFRTYWRKVLKPMLEASLEAEKSTA